VNPENTQVGWRTRLDMGKDGFRRYNDLIKSLILALGLPRPRETLTIGSDLPGATVGGLTR
jgi:hypothetical protein